MKKTGKHTGFATYVETGEFTPEFFADFEYWCRRIFKGWKFLTEFDDFYSICWEALLSKINEFDPNRATIQTFCISRINNEAWRLYMKNKSGSNRQTSDIDEPEIQNTLFSADGKAVCENLIAFSQYCTYMGIETDIDGLYKQVIEYDKNGIITDAVMSYLYWKACQGGDRDMIFSDRENVLASFTAMKPGIDQDKLISAYLIAGDALFYLLKMFEGQEINVPSARKLNMAKAREIFFIEDDKREYANCEVRDIIEYQDKTWEVAAVEKRILNHYYIAVKETDDDQ